jgi:hypothetical protein
MTRAHLVLAAALAVALLFAGFTRAAERGPHAHQAEPVKTFFYGFPPRPATQSTTALEP